MRAPRPRDGVSGSGRGSLRTAPLRFFCRHAGGAASRKTFANHARAVARHASVPEAHRPVNTGPR